MIRHVSATGSYETAEKNVGIVGLGKMGILHAGIVNSIPNARVKGVCETDRLLFTAAKSLLPKSISCYKDHSTMMRKEKLDAIFVTTPVGTHVPLVADLARADRDLSLFVEKPLAASSERARDACEAVSALRGVHMVGFQKRFSPLFQRAKESIQKGILGDPIFFKAYSFSSDVLRQARSWRFRKETGGVLLDLAPHLLDLLLWFFGEPSAVSGFRKRVYSKEVDDYVHAVMSFKSGLSGHLDVSWSIRGFRLPEVSIEFHGTNGTLVVSDDLLKIVLAAKRPSEIGESQVYYKQSFDTSVPYLLAEPEFTREDETFLYCVDRGTLPDTNFLEAARVNGLIDRILGPSEGDHS